MNMNFVLLRFTLSLVLVMLTTNSLPASAASFATLSLEPNPSVSALAGEEVQFDVWIHDYQPEHTDTPIISFGLSVEASDPALSEGGTDFSGFNFTLNALLNGVIGGGPGDNDISDDGRIDISSNLSESGIVVADTLLGSLAVVAPDVVGSYVVDFQVDPSNPISGGTFLLLDDVSFTTLPEDGDLTTLSSTMVVVPEPATVVLLLIAMLVPMLHGRKM